MLIIAGTFEVEPALRAAFLSSREEVMVRSRSERGCLDYVMSADPIEPGIVRLFERWESKEHLSAHLDALRAAPPPTTVPTLASEVVQYEISAEGRVGT